MWQAILAALVYLQTPGQSIYSQVIVPEHAPAPCSDAYSLLCLAPRWSAEAQAFTVAESWEDGIHRYATIAHAVERVVFERERSSPRDQLWRYLLAMTFHESGFRRDVHSGIGSAARGDCSWRTVKTPSGKKKRERIPGSCKSHCLGQIMLGPAHSSAKTREGYGPADLVGVDLDATARCLEVSTRIIDRAYQYCRTRVAGPLSSCIVAHYAGGMVASNDPRVLARVRTVNKLAHAPSELSRDVALLLRLEEPSEVESPAGHGSIATR